MQEQTLLSRLEQLLKRKKSKKYYAEQLNITEKEVEELMAELRDESSQARIDAETGVYISELEERVFENNVEDGKIKSTVVLDFEPKSIEELYTLHKIDKERYKITNYWSKLKSTGKFTSSVFAASKKAKDYTPEDFAKFLADYQPKPVSVYLDANVPDIRQTVDIEVSVADFHLAKKTLDRDTVESRVELFVNTVKNLISKVYQTYSINKIVFPISNDFFHTDNYQGTTTNGTPQDIIAEYDEEYELGFDALLTSIAIMRHYCNEVEVVLVQGNHDRTKAFYVAHALEVYFMRDPKVSFQRHHSVTKSTVLGNTFIGYHHGNCKIDSLPLLFSTGKNSSDWGNAKYREIHTGDKHHYMAKEMMGVRIQQMPSLSGTDRWHLDNNFVHSIRAALVLIYDSELGKIGEFEQRI